MDLMTDAHRMCIQAFLAKPMMNSEAVINLYINLCKKFKMSIPDDSAGVSKTIKEFFNIIDTNLQPFHMRIRKSLDETVGDMTYVMINTVNNNISQLESSMDSNRREYFFRIINYIIRSDGISEKGNLYPLASSPSTLNSTLSQKSLLNVLESQSTVETLIADQWLKEDQAGNIMLTQRSILELEPFIMSIGKEIEKETGSSYNIVCFLCKKICTIGKKCEECSTRIHATCIKKYNGKHNQNNGLNSCPSCKKDLS